VGALPACAESTWKPSAPPRAPSDHPRVRGKHPWRPGALPAARAVFLHSGKPGQAPQLSATPPQSHSPLVSCPLPEIPAGPRNRPEAPLLPDSTDDHPHGLDDHGPGDRTDACYAPRAMEDGEMVPQLHGPARAGGSGSLSPLLRPRGAAALSTAPVPEGLSAFRSAAPPGNPPPGNPSRTRGAVKAAGPPGRSRQKLLLQHSTIPTRVGEHRLFCTACWKPRGPSPRGRGRGWGGVRSGHRPSACHGLGL